MQKKRERKKNVSRPVGQMVAFKDQNKIKKKKEEELQNGEICFLKRCSLKFFFQFKEK